MNGLTVNQTENKSNKFVFPNIYIILVCFIVVVAALSWIIPAGQYERETLPNGRTAVVPDTYQVIDQTPVSIMDVVTAIPAGLEGAASVVFLTLLVGGSVIVLQKIGVVDMGINMLIARLGKRTELMIPILVTVFGAICAFIGTPELAIAYIPIILPLMLRLGYDSMTAAAVAIIPCTLGFAFGLTAPTNVGIGHMITGLPMFSGAWYRAIFWCIVMVALIAFILRYARKVKADPKSSSMYYDDLKLREELLTNDSSEATVEYSLRLKRTGAATMLMFVAVISCIMIFGLGFNAISGLFVMMAIIAAVMAGTPANTICDYFNEAMRVMLVGALICGVARGVSVMLETGNIMDTLVFHLASFIGALPEWSASIGVIFGQAAFNFLVPSGSGQMLVTLPILSPVADLIGMNQQVLVWSSNVADGLSNILFPTSGYFIAALVACRVDYARWVKFYFSFFVFTLIVACSGAIIAGMINYGPF